MEVGIFLHEFVAKLLKSPKWRKVLFPLGVSGRSSSRSGIAWPQKAPDRGVLQYLVLTIYYL